MPKTQRRLCPQPGASPPSTFPVVPACVWIRFFYSDSTIPPYYDSLIAKLVTRGRDRGEALARMRRALEMFIVEGVKTTIPLHRRILADPAFQAGAIDTHFLDHLGVGAARKIVRAPATGSDPAPLRHPGRGFSSQARRRRCGYLGRSRRPTDPVP